MNYPEATKAFNAFLEKHNDKLYKYITQRGLLLAECDIDAEKDIIELDKEYAPLLAERARLFDTMWSLRREHYKKHKPVDPTLDPDYIYPWQAELDEQAGFKPKIMVVKS